MPHADLKYSADLNIDPLALLKRIESIIQSQDATSGDCKGCAYPTALFHHTHLLIEVSMLPKVHRDADFVRQLRDALEIGVKAEINAPCAFSLALKFSDEGYVTNMHTPAPSGRMA